MCCLGKGIIRNTLNMLSALCAEMHIFVLFTNWSRIQGQPPDDFRLCQGQGQVRSGSGQGWVGVGSGLGQCLGSGQGWVNVKN
jgi:hypothetical protein